MDLVAKGSVNSKPEVSPAIIDKAPSPVSEITSVRFARDFQLTENRLKGLVFVLSSFTCYGGDPSWCATGGVSVVRWRPGWERDLLRDVCLVRAGAIIGDGDRKS